MAPPEPPVSPLVTLAVGYGDRQVRDWARALFAFDAQMAGIVLQAREPMLAQIRLQWWHDVLAKPVASRPSANPVLAALAPIEADGLALADALGPVIRGWEAALECEEIEAIARISRHLVFNSPAQAERFAERALAANPSTPMAILHQLKTDHSLWLILQHNETFVREANREMGMR
jgi:hypothetical protein